MMATPRDVEAYLAGLPEEMRATLEHLRKTIRDVAPRATESISYGLPTFKYFGPLVSLGAWKEHCALYGLSSTLIGEHGDELAKYDTSKGTIRFPPDKPPPAALVRRLVKKRMGENEAAEAARKERRRERARARRAT
jgi:uncharacterized protein YdhG (YjbR/CyaY superfamily)